MGRATLLLFAWLVSCGLAAGQVPPGSSPDDPGAMQGPPPRSAYPPAPNSQGQPLPLVPPPPTGPFGSGPMPAEFVTAPAREPFIFPNPAGPQRGWVDGDLLFWWLKSGPNPLPLTTTGNLADASPGALGQPGTMLVRGAQNFSYEPAAGLRLSGGYRFGDEQRFGIEGSFLFLGRQSVHRGFISDDNGDPGIYRPVNDVNFGETALFVAVPDMAAGAVFLSSTSRLWGAEAGGLFRLLQRREWNLDLVGGFRFLDLSETLNIDTFTDDFAGVLTGPANGGGAEAAGSSLAVFDSFRTRNQFYGGHMGLQTTWAFGPRWYLAARARVALGQTHQTIDINGLTVQSQPGVGFTTAAGGALAGTGNIGHFTHDAFSVVPEAELKIGYQFSRSLSGYLGYNVLYWSEVVRPGNQISRTVDLQGVPTSGIYNPAATTATAPSFAQSAFWAQGINFGLLFSY